MPAALLILLATAFDASPRAPLVVAPVRSDLDGSVRIGGRRTGVLCGPAGSTRWRDAAPDAARAADALAAALRAQGRDAVTADEVQDMRLDPRWRLVVRITSARLDACVPQGGLARLVGGRRTLKANGTVTVHWQLIDRGDASRTTEGDATATVDDRASSSLAQMTEHALTMAVTQALPTTL